MKLGNLLTGITLAALACLATSCAASRPVFNLETGSGLVPGVTTLTEAHQRLGKPDYELIRKTQEGESLLSQYHYSKVLADGSVMQGILVLESRNDLLIGYNYVAPVENAFGRNRATIPENLPEIRKGISTKVDILQLLGEPDTKRVSRFMPLPNNPAPSTEVWHWQRMSDFNKRHREIVVSFDDKGIVTGFQDNELRPREPASRPPSLNGGK
jgi:hypothetical protein